MSDMHERGADADVFLARLERLHRQLAAVRALRVACAVGAVASLAAAATAVLTRAAAFDAVLLVAGALGASIVAGAAVMVVFRPGLRATAAAADTRLGLDEHLATALHCVRDADPVSQLIVRGAAAHLSAPSAARVFAFEWPAGARTTAIGIICVAALAVAAIVGGPETATDSTASDSSSAQAQQAAVDGRPLDAAAGAARGGTPPANARRVEVPRAPADLPEPAGQPGAPGGPPPDRAAVQPGARDGAAGTARPGAEPAGRGAGATAAGAGGVSGGTLRNTPSSAPDASAEYATRYDAAWSRVQDALAQERIPRELRDYVRAYFQAIKP